MNRPGSLDFWRDQLGLLPVPLRAENSPCDFMMLNGGAGNFCLHLGPWEDHSEARSIAWSADVGHFVAGTDDFVDVHRWGATHGRSERFKASAVEARPEEFHSFLESHAPSAGESIIQHAVSVFQGLWADMEVESGEQALQAFLVLLASAHDEMEIGGLDLDRWGLSAASVDAARAIRPTAWQAYARFLTKGPVASFLTPHLELLLRHASGPLFQQAHRLAVLPRQLALPDIPRSSVQHIRNPRGQSGVFFTPPALARTLVETAISSLDLSKTRIKIFDPACGSAEFLREVLRLLRLRRYAGTIKLVGWDISQAAIDLSRFSLIREGDPGTTIELEVVDSLNREWPSDLDLILTNPPFLSWDLMSLEQRRRVSEILGDLHVRKPNLASPFILLAKQALSTNGVLGAVVPSSLTSAESTRGLRRNLAQDLDPILLAKLGSQMLFKDAVVDAALYVATKRARQDPAVAVWADHQSTSIGAALRALRQASVRSATPPMVIKPTYSIYPAADLGRSEVNWAPSSYESYSTLSRVSGFPRVLDLFDVKQGVRLGHDLFVVTKEYYDGLKPSERRFFRPAVMNRSVRDGRLFDTDYVFYPNSLGLPALTTANDVAKHTPTFFRDRLSSHQAVLAARADIKKSVWWALIRHRSWLEEPMPKIVSTYFGDAGSFAFDSVGSFVPVVGNGWIPRSRTFRRPPTEDVWDAYLAILTSQIFSVLLAAVSTHVGGGQFDLSKRYVGNARLPNLSDPGFDRSVLKELAGMGRKIRSGQLTDAGSLDGICRVAYALT